MIPYLLADEYGTIRGGEMGMNQEAIRVAFLSAQQALICIAAQNPALLNLSTFRYSPDSGARLGIDRALDVLKGEIARIEAGLQNHRASLSHPPD